MWANQSAAANRRPALQSDGSDNLSATLAADQAFPAAVAELDRYLASLMRQLFTTIPLLVLPPILGCSEPTPMTASDDQREWLNDKTANWIENERSSREDLRAEYADLFASVSEILFECDPIGINFGDNIDEYDAEAGSIIPRLRECSTEGDARRVIHEEFTKWFSDTAGEESRYTECARKIWALWETQQQP